MRCPLIHPSVKQCHPTGRAGHRYVWLCGLRQSPRDLRVVQTSHLGARSRATHERRYPVVADDTSIRPFRVNVPDEDLAELHRRIAATRLPSKELVADRSQGVQLATIQELARYWENEYDWRRCEARLNALPQFTTEIDGLN